MRAFRFSLKGLLAGFALIGFSVAALPGGSPAWSRAACGLMLLMLAIVILGVIYRRHASRAFFVGAAIFGWGYLLLWALVIPWVETTGVYVNADFSRPHLATDTLLNALHGAIEREVQFASMEEADEADIPRGAHVYEVTPYLEENWTTTSTSGSAGGYYGLPRVYTGPVAYRVPVRQNFKLAGHALITLCLALLGGYLARWFYLNSIERMTTDKN